MKIRKCRQFDLARVCEILASFDLPTEDINTLNLREFWVAEEQGQVIGVGGIERNGNIGLVRSLAVQQEHQSNGVAKKIYDAIEKYAVDKGVLRLYLLTTTAEEYFQKLGYETIDRDSAPIPIKESNQFSNLCPQSAVLMQKRLKSGMRCCGARRRN